MTNPPANDPGMSPQGRLNQLNDAELMEFHKKTVREHLMMARRYNLLKKMQGGATPTDFREALIAQQGNFDDNIAGHRAKLLRSDAAIDEQRHNLQKRYLTSPFEADLAKDRHMPEGLVPIEPGVEEEIRRVRAANPIIEPTLGNPMTPLAHPPFPHHELPSAPEGGFMPRELRPANENQPPVE